MVLITQTHKQVLDFQIPIPYMRPVVTKHQQRCQNLLALTDKRRNSGVKCRINTWEKKPTKQPNNLFLLNCYWCLSYEVDFSPSTFYIYGCEKSSFYRSPSKVLCCLSGLREHYLLALLEYFQGQGSIVGTAFRGRCSHL